MASQMDLFGKWGFYESPFIAEPPEEYRCKDPHCGHKTVWRKRRLAGAVAEGLIRLVDHYRRLKNPRPLHYDTFLAGMTHKEHRCAYGSFSILVFWDFVEPLKNEDKTKRASGYYSPRPNGMRFVDNKIKVYSHIVTNNRKFIAWSGRKFSIYEALPKWFDMEEYQKDNKMGRWAR